MNPCWKGIRMPIERLTQLDFKIRKNAKRPGLKTGR